MILWDIKYIEIAKSSIEKSLTFRLSCKGEEGRRVEIAAHVLHASCYCCYCCQYLIFR